MRVREYNEADFDALVAMHRAQGFDYALPHLADPIFVSKLVLEDGDSSGTGKGTDKIVMASLARLTCEMYLLELQRAGAADLRKRGLDDAHAWLPPPIAKRFGRRLEEFGWIRDDAWTPYCKRLR